MRISDWSSDVCSSDLLKSGVSPRRRGPISGGFGPIRQVLGPRLRGDTRHFDVAGGATNQSEERRVGEGCVSTCRFRRSPYHSKTINTHQHPDDEYIILQISPPKNKSTT